MEIGLVVVTVVVVIVLGVTQLLLVRQPNVLYIEIEEDNHEQQPKVLFGSNRNLGLT